MTKDRAATTFMLPDVEPHAIGGCALGVRAGAVQHHLEALQVHNKDVVVGRHSRSATVTGSDTEPGKKKENKEKP